MKKFLVTFIFAFTCLLNAFSYNPILVDKTINMQGDTLTAIYINLPAHVLFYDTKEYNTTSIIVRHLNHENNEYVRKNVVCVKQNNELHINLKNYPYEEMRNLNCKMVRLYVPAEFAGKIKTKNGLTINKSNLKTNDSGNQTN